MYSIEVRTGFRAGHQILLADGSREELHEHEWEVICRVSSDKLNKMGLVMDFHRLRMMIGEITDMWDGGKLEEDAYFGEWGSSAECVAKRVYDLLEGRLAEGVWLESVGVVEQAGCVAIYINGKSGRD